MKRITIETKNSRIEAISYVVSENNMILTATISDCTPLQYWLKMSRDNEYDIEIYEDEIGMWIPQNDIISVKYYEND